MLLKRLAIVLSVLATALFLQFLANRVLVGEQELQAETYPTTTTTAGAKAFEVVLKDVAGTRVDATERDVAAVQARLAGNVKDHPIPTKDVAFVPTSKRIVVVVPEDQDETQLRQRLTGRPYQRENEPHPFWYVPKGIDLRGGVEFICRLKNADGRVVPATDEVIATLRNRLDERGLTEPKVTKLSNGDAQVVIPGGTRADAARTRKVLETTGRLEFREVLGPQTGYYPNAEFPSSVPGDAKCAWIKLGTGLYRLNPRIGGSRQDIIAPKEPDPGLEPSQFMHLGPAKLTGKDVADAHESMRNGSPSLAITFTAVGAGKNHEFTSTVKQRGQTGGTGRLAIVFDGVVKSDPTVIEPSSRDCEISGHFTHDEIKDLRGVLKAGSLAVTPEILSERVVGATLGIEEVSRAFTTMFWTLATLVAFLGIYYRRLGVVAIGSVAINGALTWTTLAVFGATLTLPGIAGLILSLAMGIDTNILIYERIREEMREDKGLPAAIDAGYTRAFLTVIDSHLTTISAGLMLYLIGSGPVKGFGLTLMIGIAISLFSGIYVGRLLTEFLCRRKQTLSMMYLCRPIHIGYCRLRKLSYVLVAATAVIGIGYFAFGHKLTPGASFDRNFDIEFTGGTLVQVSFKEPQEAKAVELAIEQAWAKVPEDQRKESLLNPREIQRQAYVQNLAQKGSASRQWVFRVRDEEGAKLEQQRHDLELENAALLKQIETLREKTPPDTAQANRLEKEQFVPLKKRIDDLGTEITNRTEVFKHELAGAFGGLVAAEGDEVLAASWKDERLTLDIATIDQAEPNQADAIAQKIAYMGRETSVKPLAAGKGLSVGIAFREPPRAPQQSQVAETTDPGTRRIEHLLLAGGVGADEARAVAAAGGQVFEAVVNAAAAQQVVVAQPFPASQHFSGQVADRMKLQAVLALSAAMILMMLYIAARFELAFGLGAVVSLLHVVIQTLGLVALFNIRIDLTIIAAFLTIVGYAINDTIVTYDRIRENLGKMAGKPLEEIVDTSIAEVMPRTILTGGHVALALVIMLVFAGESLRGFCSTLLIGILLGTYSSVFVASPLLLSFRKRMETPPAAPADGSQPAATAG